MSEQEQFDAALRWVEHDLKNVVTVRRLTAEDAEIGDYHVGKAGGEWVVWENDEDFGRLSEHDSPMDAVAFALSHAVPDAFESAF